MEEHDILRVFGRYARLSHFTQNFIFELFVLYITLHTFQQNIKIYFFINQICVREYIRPVETAGILAAS